MPTLPPVPAPNPTMETIMRMATQLARGICPECGEPTRPLIWITERTFSMSCSSCQFSFDNRSTNRIISSNNSKTVTQPLLFALALVQGLAKETTAIREMIMALVQAGAPVDCGELGIDIAVTRAPDRITAAVIEQHLGETLKLIEEHSNGCLKTLNLARPLCREVMPALGKAPWPHAPRSG